MRKFRRNRKGISTVIATIIIVAITIVMAIAVAYWALGIGGSFTRFEKLQYSYGYVTGGGSAPWLINIQVQNTGTAQATINNIYLNGQPANTYTTAEPIINGTALTTISSISSQTLPPGATCVYTLSLPQSTSVWASGMSVEVSIQTAAGNSYPKTMTLP